MSVHSTYMKMKRPFRVANGGLTAAIRSARGTRTRRLPAVQFQSAFEVMHMLHLPAVASAAAKAGAGLRRVNFNFSEEMETCETILSSEQGTPEYLPSEYQDIFLLQNNDPTANPCQSRYVILTTPQSFATQVEIPLAIQFIKTFPIEYTCRGHRKPTRPPIKYLHKDTVIWSQIFCDECHQRKISNIYSICILRSFCGLSILYIHRKLILFI